MSWWVCCVVFMHEESVFGEYTTILDVFVSYCKRISSDKSQFAINMMSMVFTLPTLNWELSSSCKHGLVNMRRIIGKLYKNDFLTGINEDNKIVAKQCRAKSIQLHYKCLKRLNWLIFGDEWWWHLGLIEEKNSHYRERKEMAYELGSHWNLE